MSLRRVAFIATASALVFVAACTGAPPTTTTTTTSTTSSTLPPPPPPISVDQQVTATTANGVAIVGCSPTVPSPGVGQTFVAGRTATLVQVSLALVRSGSPGPLNVSVQTTSAGLPTGTVLASGTYDGPGSGQQEGFVDVSLTGLPTLTAGTQYAIVADVTQCATTSDTWRISAVGASNTDAYPQGTQLARDSGSSTWRIFPSAPGTPGSFYSDLLFTTWTF